MATARVDGRKGIDGLSALVRSQFAEDPLSGSMYVFFSRRSDRVRVLYFDRDGYVLITKRLEKGTYRLPWSAEPELVVIEAAELLLVLEGIDLRIEPPQCEYPRAKNKALRADRKEVQCEDGWFVIST